MIGSFEYCNHDWRYDKKTISGTLGTKIVEYRRCKKCKKEVYLKEDTDDK